MEDVIGKPLSPYAFTKYFNELYSDVFARCYGFNAVGQRYFNVFGHRQDPNAAYAAVIPKWIAAMIKNETVFINGDGETSRDFCYVENTIQANLLAAMVRDESATAQVYNVATGGQTSLNQLYFHMRDTLAKSFSHLKEAQPTHRDFRIGDVRYSFADIGKAKKLLGYQPTHQLANGLNETINWYIDSIVNNCCNRD